MPNFVPVIGARTRAQLEDALDSLSHRLNATELEGLENLVPAEAGQGTRVPGGKDYHPDEFVERGAGWVHEWQTPDQDLSPLAQPRPTVRGLS